MEKEFLKEMKHSVTLNVTGGKIDSFRELEKTTGTVRVYDKGCIGVAGCLGEPDEKDLTSKAEEALSFGIPYPCILEGPLVMEDIHEKEIIRIADLVPEMQSLLDRLGEMCPRFAFSNKINLTTSRTEYINSAGRHLKSSGSSFSVELLVQSLGSGNLFDTFLAWGGDRYDPDYLKKKKKKQYDAFYTPADIEPGRYPVISGTTDMFGPLIQHFIGDLYFAGASLLSGKLGNRIFSDKLTLKDDMNQSLSSGVCFFDAEGCVAPDFRPALIENGVLKGLLTTKKTAEQYGLPNLGTASADYDGVPEPGLHSLYPEATAKTIGELVPGKAIYVVVASGGDMTPEGHFATPVQMSYLVENGQLIGRLPGLSISGEFYDILGKDYIGSVHNAPMENSLTSAVIMNVEKA